MKDRHQLSEDQKSDLRLLRQQVLRSIQATGLREIKPPNSTPKLSNPMIAMNVTMTENMLVFGHEQNQNYDLLKQSGISDNGLNNKGLSEKANEDLVDLLPRGIDGINDPLSLKSEKERTPAKEATSSAREIPTDPTNSQDLMEISNSHNKHQHEYITTKEQEKQETTSHTSAKALNIPDTSLSAEDFKQPSGSIIAPYREQSLKYKPRFNFIF